jgi:hypothetical protein
MTPTEAQAFLRRIMGPPKRTLEGQEREHVLTLLSLTQPFKESNNQHSWTSYYKIGDKEYHVTTFPGESDIVDELLSEDIK